MVRLSGLDQQMGDDRLSVACYSVIERDSIRILWRSRRYNWPGGGIEVSGVWGIRTGSDPRMLFGYIQELIGGQIHHLERCNVPDIGASLRAMELTFEHAINRRMESLEHAGGYRDNFSDRVRVDALFGWQALAPQVHSPVDQKAVKKARDLLRDQLNDEQRAQFDATEQFQVIGKDRKTYTIKKARSFNVTGPDGVRYCGQTVDTPLEDQMLAQKLLLENDPEKFFKNCNRSGGAAIDSGIINALAAVAGSLF